MSFNQQIQSLRGVAIIGVLLFHFWPQVFPNGYVGVDIFFVLSGYLMAMILTSNKAFSIETVVTFYYRRLKRILPLYYTIIFLTFIFSQVFVLSAWLRLTNRHALYSMFFAKNLETVWDGKDYWNAFKSAEPNRDPYLHCWSLCVEVQFYAIVPLIFLIYRQLPSHTLKNLFFFLIFFGSLTHYLRASNTEAFNLMFCRIWQFVAGMTAYAAPKSTSPIGDENIGLLSSKVEEVTELNSSNTDTGRQILITMTLMTLLLPYNFSQGPYRFVFTVVTAIVLYDKSFEIHALQLQGLSYLGDMSYSVYLIHWPLIVFVQPKYIFSSLLLLVVILLLSAVSYQLYEEWYRKLSLSGCLILVGVLIIANAFAYRQLEQNRSLDEFLAKFKQGANSELYRINRDLPTMWVNKKKCVDNVEILQKHPELPNLEACDFAESNGKKKILVIGNSFAGNEINVIEEAFGGRYSKMRLISSPGMQVIYPVTTDKSSEFFPLVALAMEQISHYKPDLTIVVTRFDATEMEYQLKNPDTDYYLKEMQKNVKFIEEHTAEQVLIQGPLPFYLNSYKMKFLDAIEEGIDLSTLHARKEVGDREMNPTRQRLSSIKCNKCKVFDVADAFLEIDKYLGFDLKAQILYFDDSVHFTTKAKDRLQPLYDRAISEYLSNITF